MTQKNERATLLNRPVRADGWGPVDNLLRDLQGRQSAPDQVRSFLEAVRTGSGADVVCWLPGTSGGAFQAIGDRPLKEEWCQQLLRERLGSGEAGSQLCGPGDKGQSGGATPSAALVCLNKARSIWALALRFAPARTFRPSDLRLMALLRRVLLSHRRQALAQEKLQGALFGLVRCLAAAIGAKHAYTRGHSERVARIAVRLGARMGIGAAGLSNLYLAGLLHDVGKIGIHTAVLLSEGRLTDEERAHVEQHPVIGEAILAEVPSLGAVRQAVRHHHEHYDGRGYPDGLAGESIPLAARILAVADSCDAMFSARPYRPGMPAERVDAILTAGAGTQWDPEVVGHFMACRKELYGLSQAIPGDSVLRAVEELVNGWQEE